MQGRRKTEKTHLKSFAAMGLSVCFPGFLETLCPLGYSASLSIQAQAWSTRAPAKPAFSVGPSGLDQSPFPPGCSGSFLASHLDSHQVHLPLGCGLGATKEVFLNWGEAKRRETTCGCSPLPPEWYDPCLCSCEQLCLCAPPPGYPRAPLRCAPCVHSVGQKLLLLRPAHSQ